MKIFGPPKPTQSRHREHLLRFLLALNQRLHGDKTLQLFKDHFNQLVHEAKIVCKDPRDAKGFKSESYYLARCMSKYKDLQQDIMKINSLDDVDDESAKRILLRLEPAFARS